MARIVLIGAGSSVFGYNSVQDACNIEALQGSSLVLHDIDEGRLEEMASLAAKIVGETGSEVEVGWTSHRVD